MSEVLVPRQFRGPPVTANGGYICGVMANAVGGKGTAMLRAGVLVDQPHKLGHGEDGEAFLTNADGQLVATAKPLAPGSIPEPPAPPSVEDARRFAATSPFAAKSLHRGCFSCCIEREAGEGLGVFVGQIEGAPAGHCAGVWRPHANFADADGRMPDEITWGALDCSGSMAWYIKTGTPVGLLGTMSGEVIEKPKAGEDYVVLAWAQENEGRKFFSGVALFDKDGKLVAKSGQIWIGRPPMAAQPVKAEAAAK